MNANGDVIRIGFWEVSDDHWEIAAVVESAS